PDPVLLTSASQTPIPSRQTSDDGANAFEGHAVLDPVHASAVSHSPPAGLQTLPALPATCAQAPLPLQRSSVHGFESLAQATPEATRQLFAASLHALAHSPPPAHGLPDPVQTPLTHPSLTVPKSASL